jgi:hypothetical protein
MKNPNNLKGEKFENKVQKTIASGRFWSSKGDLRCEDYCIECKYTDKKGFRLTTAILEKLWSQALDSSKEPMISIGIKRNDNEIFIVEGLLRVERK